MKPNMSRQNYSLILLFVLFTLSCNKGKILPAPETEGFTKVEFKLAMHSAQKQAVTTYAISDFDETVIKQIILLAFKVSGGIETLVYYKEGMQIYNTVVPNEKSFYTNLLKSTDTYRFVLLVNGGVDLSDIVENIPIGTEKSLVMDQLVANLAGKWNAGSSSNFDPLFMWGESGVVLGINAQTVVPSIKLLRSLARIDVKLDADALTNFSITSVNIYDANNKVRLAPLPANYNDVTNFISAASIPAGTLQSLDFVYDGFGQVTVLEREIYIAEAVAGTTRIVIGGIFGTDPVPTYYEAALSTALLRNNRYVINITKVNASGVLLPADALSFKMPDGSIGDKNRISSVQLKNTGTLSHTVLVIPDDQTGSNVNKQKGK